MLQFTTPFGRRPLTAAQIEAQLIAGACPAETTVDKWAVLRHISSSRTVLGLADRTVAVLSALLSFHRETVLRPRRDGRLVVFPSNAQLRQRAHGIAETTLRSHLAVLVEAGIVIRRDSPNGKRYAQKGHAGELVEAFGFDLVPLVARAAEFAALAERLDTQRRAERAARESVSLQCRDLSKLIGWARTTAMAGPWDALAARLEALNASRPRRPTAVVVETLAANLSQLMVEAHKLLNLVVESTDPGGNDAETRGRHQSSDPEYVEIEEPVEDGLRIDGPPHAQVRERTPTYPLGMVLDACPDIVHFAKGGVRSWLDLGSVAELTRRMLGVDDAVWWEARDAMGAEMAAVTVAAILQRGERIRSPTAYLRSLTERTRRGRFSLGPVLRMLMNERGAAASIVPENHPNDWSRTKTSLGVI